MFYLNIKIFIEENKRTQTTFKIVFGLNQVMLRRHQGLVLDYCKNEHDEGKNAIGLHGSSDRLLLPGHHFQLIKCHCEDDPGGIY